MKLHPRPLVCAAWINHPDFCSLSLLEYVIVKEGKPFQTVSIRDELMAREKTMDTLLSVLTRLQKQGAALGHFNVADLVLVKAVFSAASENRAAVLIGASEGERHFFGARQLAALVKSLRDESDLPAFLNADHTHSLAKAREAANAGFDLVGIDFSALPFEQNVARTKEAVEAVKTMDPYFALEGEKGQIGSGSDFPGSGCELPYFLRCRVQIFPVARATG